MDRTDAKDRLVTWRVDCPMTDGCGATTDVTPIDRSTPRRCPWCGYDGVTVRVSPRDDGEAETPRGEVQP